jgi:3-oxoacyl-[acyl-carrier protein] reductase
LTEEPAIGVATQGIRANCINPVATETPFLGTFIGGRDMEEGKKAVISGIPLGRLAQPEDIAYAALYLASDGSPMVPGACIDVDGGRGV